MNDNAPQPVPDRLAPKRQPRTIAFEGRTYTLAEPWRHLPDPERPEAPLLDSPFNSGPFYSLPDVAPDDWLFMPDSAFLMGQGGNSPSSMHCVQQRAAVATARPVLEPLKAPESPVTPPTPPPA